MSCGSSAVIIMITYFGQKANECALTKNCMENLYKMHFETFAAHHQIIKTTILMRDWTKRGCYTLTNVQKYTLLSSYIKTDCLTSRTFGLNVLLGIYIEFPSRRCKVAFLCTIKGGLAIPLLTPSSTSPLV